MIAAVCVLVRKEDRILALRRSRHKDAAPGIWEALSGRMQPGEAPEAAAVREVMEESGLEVELDPRPLEAHATTRAGIPMLILYYRARWIAGEVRISAEHEEHAWLDAREFARRTPIPELSRAVAKELGTPARIRPTAPPRSS